MHNHPFLRTRTTRIAFLGIWILVSGIYYAFMAMGYPDKWVLEIFDVLLYNFLFSLITLLLWNAIRFSNPEKMSISQVLIYHVGLLAICEAAWIGTGYLIMSSIVPSGYQQHFLDTLSSRIISGLFFYSISILIYYLIMYYQNFRESALKEAELQALMKEAELSILRSQIKPHFLFNSLNSISSLTLSNPARAQEMIIKLSDFIRYSLAESERKMVPLRAELDYIRLYLDIEKVRFGEKLLTLYDIGDKCLECQLPNMILQPLYENAVKHGVYESTEPVEIRTTVSCTGNSLKIVISNTFDPESLARKGKGLGLKNIINRMHLIYHREDLIRIEKKGNQYEVSLFIPQDID